MKSTKSFTYSGLFFSFTILSGIFLIIACSVFLLKTTQRSSYGKQGAVQFASLIAKENTKENGHIFQFNDTYAYLVKNKSVYFVTYQKSAYPLCIVCGTYTTSSVINIPSRQGDYLYSTYPNAENRFGIFNLKTLSYTEVSALYEFTEASLDTAAIESHLVTTEEAASVGDELSLEKSSCVDITLAGLIVTGVSGLLWGLFALKEKKKKIA